MKDILPSSQKTEARSLLTPSEWKQWEGLLAAAFRVPQGGSFFDDFPVWAWQSGADVAVYGIFSTEGKLLAAAGLRFAELERGPSLSAIRVAILGGVVTDPRERKMGLASQIVEALVAQARIRGVDLIALFGGSSSLYGRQGFRPLGEQWRVTLRDLQIPSTGFDVIPKSGFKAWLFDHLRESRRGLRFEERDRTWLFRHKNVDWMTFGSAYVACGRGIDLKGVIHEWGGDRIELVKLLGWLRARTPDVQLLCNPSLLKYLGLPTRAYEKDPTCFALALTEVAQSATADPSTIWFWGLDGA